MTFHAKDRVIIAFDCSVSIDFTGFFEKSYNATRTILIRHKRDKSRLRKVPVQGAFLRVKPDLSLYSPAFESLQQKFTNNAAHT